MEDQDLRLLEREASICKALGNVKRLQIVYMLKNRELSAGEIAEALDTTPANASQHLNAMRQAGILESQRQGSNILYRVANKWVHEACAVIRSVLREQLTREQAMLRTTTSVAD